MTKDSICKDCEFRKYGVHEVDGERHEEASCKKMAVDGDASRDIKVVHCSEYAYTKDSPGI